METAALILLINILVLVIACLIILVTMLYRDKKEADKLDLFLECFSEFTSMISKYFDLVEDLIRKNKGEK